MRGRWLSGAILASGLVLAAGAGGITKPDADFQPVPLGEGRVGKGYAWGAWMERPHGPEGQGPGGGLRPFVTVGILDLAHNLGSETGLGTALPGRLRSTGEPVIVTGTASKNGRVAMSATAMVFAPGVRVVKTVEGGRVRTYRLRALNPRQMRKSRLAALRYAAFAVRGTWCPRRIESFNERGVPLWESKEACLPNLR